MSFGPLHGAVLGAAAVVSSPSLWLTLVEGTLPLDDALTRYLVSVAVCWAALNAVALMVLPPPRRATPASAAPAGSGVDGVAERVPTPPADAPADAQADAQADAPG